MTDRKRPPDRRWGPLVSYTVGGMKYTAHANSGELTEMFLNCGKEGSSANIIARECAVIFSIARQYGVPLDAIRNALPLLHNGKPAGPVGCALFLFEHPEVTPEKLVALQAAPEPSNVVQIGAQP